jgi:hypothetical protein
MPGELGKRKSIKKTSRSSNKSRNSSSSVKRITSFKKSGGNRSSGNFRSKRSTKRAQTTHMTKSRGKKFSKSLNKVLKAKFKQSAPSLIEAEKKFVRRNYRKVTMTPSKNAINEIERPIPYNKRLNSPTLRKVKLHYERIRCYKIQKANYEFRVQ